MYKFSQNSPKNYKELRKFIKIHRIRDKDLISLEDKKIEKENSNLSAEIVTSDGEYSPEFLNQEHQVFMDRAIPKSVDIKSMKAADLGKYPLLNDPFAAGVISMPFGRPPDVDRKTLMQYVKFTPEIVSIFNAIIEDIISDGYEIEPIEDVRGSGKTKVKRAEEFLQRNHFKELLTSILWDVLGTGDAYVFKSRVTMPQVRGIVEETVNKLPIQFKSQGVDYVMESLKQSDEDIFSTRALELIPSSTVQIKYTHAGVISYVQRVGANIVEFSPEEVIHMRLWRIDGKIYGYTPMQSITGVVDILFNIREYARYYFEKGGVPNYLFIYPNETPDSPNVKSFKKTLQLYSSLINKYKNIVATGEITPIELNKMNQDMQFKELAIYLTQVIVMAWQIPSSRLSDMLIAKGLRGATISIEGYYRKISHLQDVLEDIVNNEILGSFKVRLKFNKAYTIDEIKEVQRDLFRRDVIEKTQSILGTYNKKLKEREVLQQLSLDEDDVEEGKAEMQFPNNRQNFLRNEQLLSQDQEKLAQDRDKQKIALQKKEQPIFIKPNPDGTFMVKFKND